MNLALLAVITLLLVGCETPRTREAEHDAPSTATKHFTDPDSLGHRQGVVSAMLCRGGRKRESA
jgi:PBP1b-binding outer membrane lipoprotein LpoB